MRELPGGLPTPSFQITPSPPPPTPFITNRPEKSFHPPIQGRHVRCLERGGDAFGTSNLRPRGTSASFIWVELARREIQSPNKTACDPARHLGKAFEPSKEGSRRRERTVLPTAAVGRLPKTYVDCESLFADFRGLPCVFLSFDSEVRFIPTVHAVFVTERCI